MQDEEMTRRLAEAHRQHMAEKKEQNERLARAVRQQETRKLDIDGHHVVLNAHYYHEEGRVPEYMFSMQIKDMTIARTIRASEGLPFNMKQNINVVMAQNAAFLRNPPANVLTGPQQERLLDKIWFLTQDDRNNLMIDAALIGRKESRERLAPLPGALEERKG